MTLNELKLTLTKSLKQDIHPAHAQEITVKTYMHGAMRCLQCDAVHDAVLLASTSPLNAFKQNTIKACVAHLSVPHHSCPCTPSAHLHSE